MTWKRVTIPRVLKRSKDKLTILFVHEDGTGQWSVGAVPRRALKQLGNGDSNSWLMHSNVAEHFTAKAKRHDGKLNHFDMWRSAWIYGPIGKAKMYIDIIGHVMN